jgi:hypothetical protein
MSDYAISRSGTRNMLGNVAGAILCMLWLVVLSAPVARAEVASAKEFDVETRFQGVDTLVRLRRAEGVMPRLSDPRDAPTLLSFWDGKAFLREPPYTVQSLAQLMPMFEQQNRVMKAYVFYARDATTPVDTERNSVEFQDEVATALALLIRTAAAINPAMSNFIQTLPPEQMTDIRRAGLAQARLGFVQMLTGAAMTLRDSQYRANNQRMMTAAMAHSATAISEGLIPAQRNELITIIRTAVPKVTAEAKADLDAVLKALSQTACINLCLVK